jgi:hypothetical protein
MHVTDLPRTPCAFDEEFLEELLYEPSVLMLEELLELDPERSLVVCRMRTEPVDPVTDRGGASG